MNQRILNHDGYSSTVCTTWSRVHFLPYWYFFLWDFLQWCFAFLIDYIEFWFSFSPQIQMAISSYKLHKLIEILLSLHFGRYSCSNWKSEIDLIVLQCLTLFKGFSCCCYSSSLCLLLNVLQPQYYNYCKLVVIPPICRRCILFVLGDKDNFLVDKEC